ncbi:MAG: class I SAM-dependent methyltransferase [Phycisphaerales bacterium]|nr:class I SAM-dependent methyltransferase [Phycisphaerales bacterium]
MARKTARRATESRDKPAQPLSLYDCPQWYDIVHEAGTAAEVTQLQRINERHGTGGRRWLEPACGTGRFLRVLASRGCNALGYDASPIMLDYARRRLKARGLSAQLCLGDMATFVRPRTFDIAFNLINTFRHLLDPLEALSHLNCIARSLKRGGVYVLGIDLVDYDDPQPGEEVWIARRGRCRVRHVMFNVPPDRPRRRERIINHLIVDKPSGRSTHESHYDLRSYNLSQWLGLLEESELDCVAAYDFDWQPIQITGYTRDVNLVLARESSR